MDGTCEEWFIGREGGSVDDDCAKGGVKIGFAEGEQVLGMDGMRELALGREEVRGGCDDAAT